MPRGKEFCAYEQLFFPNEAFKTEDGTKIHDVQPPHRATDGVLVKIENGKVTPLQDPPPPPTPLIVE